MAAKHIAGLINRKGIWHINKQYRGRQIRKSTYTSDRQEAEAILIQIIAEIDRAKDFRQRPCHTWRSAATKYLLENQHKPSIELIALQLRYLDNYIGHLELSQIHDGTLSTFIRDRMKQGFNEQAKNGVKNRTINIALNLIITILNHAARVWRDENGFTWLETVPKITRLDEKPQKRTPYPLSWNEQHVFFKELPEHLRSMALFKINTGTREQEVCQLEWDWEIKVPELNTSVFLIPAGFGGRTGKGGVKNRDERLIVLNSVAKKVVEAQRGKHNKFVFTYKGQKVGRILNNGWKNARDRAAKLYASETGTHANIGFRKLRVHDLKHTYGHRLRVAGVPEEDRKDLLGHKSNRSVTTDYSAPALERLIEYSERVLETDNRQRKALTIIRRKSA